MDLQPYIHSFWSLSSKPDPVFSDTVFRFVPDGHPEWMFNLGAPTSLRLSHQLSGQSPRSHFLGHFSRHLDITFPTSGFHIFSIKFQPWAAHLFWKDAMKAYTDEVVDLGQGQDLEELETKIHEGQNAQERVRIAEEILRKMLIAPVDAELKHCFQALQTTASDFKVEDIMDQSSVSKRRLEQVFSEKIGLPPKAIHRIHRIRRSIDFMRDHPGHSLTHVAHEFNFFDQSHFTREFKRFTGFTPKRFLHLVNPDTGMLNFKLA